MKDGVNQELQGTAKADNIFTKSGDDTITGGKGNDIIYIDGEGDKTIIIDKGDGNDTIFTTGKSKESTIDVELSNPTIFKRDGLDFIISNGSESVRLKNYSTLISMFLGKDDYTNFKLNGESLKTINETNPITTQIKVSKGSSVINQIASLVGGKKEFNAELKKAVMAN